MKSKKPLSYWMDSPAASWRVQVAWAYGVGVRWLRQQGAEVRYSQDGLEEWLKGFGRARTLIAHYPAFAALIAGDGGWSTLPVGRRRRAMPKWLKKNYVTVCSAYRAAGAPDRLTGSFSEALKAIYSQQLLSSAVSGSGSPLMRWVRRGGRGK